MSRSRTVLLGLLVLVVCAGCVSPPTRPSTVTSASATPSTLTVTETPPATESTTVTATDRPSVSETPTATTGHTTDCPSSLQVDAATEAQRSRVDRVLAYSDLSPARQREFDAALANGSTELGDTLPETWAGPRIVSYRGTPYYAVASVC